METYLFIGCVLPERAQLSLEFGIKFVDLASKREATAKVSIILNQVAVTVQTEDERDIYDLRNIVKNVLQSHLAILGYIHAYAYDLEITRVINSARNVDYVFGIDIPGLADQIASFDKDGAVAKLREMSAGMTGVFIRRCLNDLVSAMKFADDTGFYCFRALESLRLHHAAVNGWSEKEKGIQWEKFRETIGYTEEQLAPLTKASKADRHGEVTAINGEERLGLLKLIWTIVEKYLQAQTPNT
jgi:hypothetical protein